MKCISDPKVKSVFDKYPATVLPQMNRLRALILESASEIESLQTIEETLKWGEPSYLTKHGSTLRMDWKAKSPDQYAMYFKCTSKLVTTFKTIFKDKFIYEGTRAIVFKLNDKVPEKEMKQCIKMALTYHKIKQLPLLGF
ncbi:DUF1801 domain-containing protein [Aurantibacter crassamenti]|uniref:DUF1801 domain-containing protein n=1 Tax=Aurantibacter crassamenti TaxID=1837375 RepID=UPI001939CFCF|nr:DUF1801 domain-containing protein [Aurantibacter crassamenti]MBM1106327.1 DUF1801 domain-containing protein [Aurantibacter crassamenti]